LIDKACAWSSIPRSGASTWRTPPQRSMPTWPFIPLVYRRIVWAMRKNVHAAARPQRPARPAVRSTSTDAGKKKLSLTRFPEPWAIPSAGYWIALQFAAQKRRSTATSGARTSRPRPYIKPSDRARQRAVARGRRDAARRDLRGAAARHDRGHRHDGSGSCASVSASASRTW